MDETTNDLNVFHMMAAEWDSLKRRVAELEARIAATPASAEPEFIREDDVLYAVRTLAAASVLRKMGGSFTGEAHYFGRALKEAAVWESMEFKNGHSLAAFLRQTMADERSPIVVTVRGASVHHRNPEWTLSLRDCGVSSK